MTIAQILSAISDKQSAGEVREIGKSEADALQRQWARNKERFVESML
jgi:hypothetical protein